jgi:hypothetical protein
MGKNVNPCQTVPAKTTALLRPKDQLKNAVSVLHEQC